MTQERAPRRATFPQRPNSFRGIGLQNDAATPGMRRANCPPHRVDGHAELLVVDVGLARPASLATAESYMPRRGIERRFEVGRPRFLDLPEVLRIARL